MIPTDINSWYLKTLKKHFLIASIYWSVAIIFYFFSAYLQEDSVHYLFQKKISYILIFCIYLHLLLFTISQYRNLRKLIKTFLLEKVHPINLSIFRIVLFGSLIPLYFFQLKNAELLDHRAQFFQALHYTEWYAWIFSMNYQVYKILFVLGVFFAFISMIGLFYKKTAWLNIFFSLILLGAPMFLGKLYYFQIHVWACCILAFAPASDVLSIDSIISKTKSTPNYEYGLPLKLIWVLLGIIYFFSAIGKLSDLGLYWALSDNAVRQIQVEWITNYQHIPWIRIDHYPLFIKASSFAALILEISFPFLIFHRQLRKIAILGGLSLHFFATYFMHLSMLNLQVIYFSFINLFRQNTVDSLKFTIDSNFKKVLYIGLVMIVINFVYGALRIDSWPFSAYPSHSAKIDQYYSRIVFEIPEVNLNYLDIDSIGSKNNFHIDNFEKASLKSIEAFNQQDSLLLLKSIHLLWSNWQINNPELKEYHQPSVYILETNVHPDSTRKKENLQIIFSGVDLRFY